jgi:hypothetical protein
VAVDGTGDGDVATRAGAPIVYGRDCDGLCHQYSQSAAEVANGKLGLYNFDAGNVDGRSVADLTRGRRHGVQFYWRPDGYSADQRPFNLAYLLGQRQSRHVVGHYTLTLDDQVTNRHFPDVVAYGSCHQDNHAYDYENENDEAMLWIWTLGFWKRPLRHQLPYGCLIPQRVTNLLVACRAVSVSREAHMLFRMIRDMYRIGEAAGHAAALAVSRGGDVRQVDIGALQDALRQTGALLEDWPAEEIVPGPEALVAELADAAPRVAVWHLYQQGEAAVPALLAGLRSGNGDTRWWCAVALAMIGRAEAAEVLLEALATRDPRKPTVDPAEPSYYLSRMAPRWLSAAVLLGKLRERRALPLLTGLLEEPADGPDVLITAVRSLGRIGDPAAVERLRQFIQRDDLPTTGEYQNSLQHGQPLERDVAWQLRLATAEVLRGLGSPMPELALPYLDDERAYVREYAARLV